MTVAKKVPEESEETDALEIEVDLDEAGDRSSEEGSELDEPDDGLTGGTLLPRVQELLTRIFDQAERQRFERFFTAAAVAIEGLGALDLSEPEGDPASASGRTLDLLPPSVPRALERLGRFLRLVAEEFPAPDAGDDDDLDFDLGPSDGPLDAAPAEQGGPEALAKALDAFRLNIDHELRMLQEALEGPPEADLWPILERLGEFRGRTRSGIGEMFFLAAREHAVVRKEDVVPFYKEDVDGSLALRRAITTLRARIDVHRTRLDRLLEGGDEAGEKVATCLAALHGVFDAFMQTDPYASLRVVDRRSCSELREALADLMGKAKPPRRQVENAVEGLAKFLDSLTLVNQRELLIVHDRDAVADTEAQLDAVEAAVVEDRVDLAREALGRAVRTAEPLFGREPTFDGLLKLLRHVDPEQLDLDDTLALAGLMRRQL